jgi:hypothetical protein
MQMFLEDLTATHDAKFFLNEAECLGHPLPDDMPLSLDSALQTVHPVICTNRK